MDQTSPNANGVRVLVCGGRNYRDRKRVFAVLDSVHDASKIACIIEGGANGADQIAHDWAVERGVDWEMHPADWDRYGKLAGPLRNAHMLTRNVDLVVAFPGGKGTSDMVTRAVAAKVAVSRIE